MQNLNQIRARNVLEFANSAPVRGRNGGEVIKKIPPVIMNNGIMAALAYFGSVKGKNGGEVVKKIPPVIMNNGIMAALAYSLDKGQQAWRGVFDAIAVHLSSQEIAMIPADKNSAELLLDYLASEATSVQLRDITAESFEWLNFARRLVK